MPIRSIANRLAIEQHTLHIGVQTVLASGHYLAPPVARIHLVLSCRCIGNKQILRDAGRAAPCHRVDAANLSGGLTEDTGCGDGGVIRAAHQCGCIYPDITDPYKPRRCAVRLYRPRNVEANELFLSRCTAFYGARLYQADLDTDGARRAVNNWVGEVTRGLIPEVLAETPAPETVLLLVNALYLKNAWASEFDPLDTRPGDFTAADGSEAETDFLSNGLRAEQYFAAEGAAGVVLPYDDGRLGFLAVLPDGELDAWLETLDGDTLPALLAAAEEERVLLRLPKFEAEWGGELSDALAAMGLETAFDSGRADFSALGTAPAGPLYVSSVVHKARIEVNEKGTEAAAATVVEVEDAAAPTDYRELVLDRPFCYAVVDLERGVPLFLGTFERP